MNQKVQAAGEGAGAAGALATVLVWVAGESGVDIPPEVAAAITTLLAAAAATLAGYLRREKP